MTIATLEKALEQSRPFTLYLTDGRKIEVPHPEFLWLVRPHRSELVVSHGRTGGTEILRVNQIVSIFWKTSKAA